MYSAPVTSAYRSRDSQRPNNSRGYYPNTSKRSQGKLPPETSVGINIDGSFGFVCASSSSCHFHCTKNASDRFRVVGPPRLEPLSRSTSPQWSTMHRTRCTSRRLLLLFPLGMPSTWVQDWRTATANPSDNHQQN